MRKIFVFAIFLVLLFALCACADKKPIDTITYARYDDETEATASKPEEGKQTEASGTGMSGSESESTQPEQTETEAVIVPGEVRFSGFTPIAENTSPVDMNGIDLSAFDENSAEYAVYSDIGKLAVISTELKLYNKEANYRIEQKKIIEPSCPFMVYVYEQSYGRVVDLRGKILGLLTAFNVSEYVGEKEIEHIFSNKFSETLKAYKNSCNGDSDLSSLFNDRSWQQDMMNENIKEINSVCNRLLSLKENGVSYGNEMDELILAVKSLSEELSGFWDEMIEMMMDPVYPYPYTIERAFYKDCMLLYIYTDNNTKITDTNYTNEVSKDIYYFKYNKDLKRYELFWNYDKVRSGWLLTIQHKTTKIRKNIRVSTLSQLNNIVDIGDINPETMLKMFSPAIRTMLVNAFGEDLTLFDLNDIYSIEMISDAAQSGISEIILGGGTNTQGKIILADVKFDTTMPATSLDEIERLFEYSRITSQKRKVVNAEKGTLILNYDEVQNMFEYTNLSLFGYNEELNRSKDILSDEGYMVNDYCFLSYDNSQDIPVYHFLIKKDDMGRFEATGIKFDLDFNFLSKR